MVVLLETNTWENWTPKCEYRHSSSRICPNSSNEALEGRHGKLSPLFGSLCLLMQGGRCPDEGFVEVSHLERFGKP